MPQLRLDSKCIMGHVLVVASTSKMNLVYYIILLVHIKARCVRYAFTQA